MNDESEIVETEAVSGEELAELTGHYAELHGAKSEAELQRVVREHIVNDFEQALNLIRNYQLLVKRMFGPDVHFDEAHALLAKYRMESVDPIHAVHDGQYGDISTHTTSIPGEAEEITTEVFEAVFEGKHSLPPGKYVVDDPEYDENFTYGITIQPNSQEDTIPAISFAREQEGSEQNLELRKALREDAGEVYAPEPSQEFRELAERDGMDAIDQRLEEIEPQFAEELMQQTAARLAADGYVECPICEGTGKALKGVLKGRKCARCNGLGMWREPETLRLVGDEHGNIGIQRTRRNPDMLDAADEPDSLSRFDDPDNDPYRDDAE